MEPRNDMVRATEEEIATAFAYASAFIASIKMNGDPPIVALECIGIMAAMAIGQCPTREDRDSLLSSLAASIADRTEAYAKEVERVMAERSETDRRADDYAAAIRRAFEEGSRGDH